MATVADRFWFKERHPDLLSGTPRAHAIDRWIVVFMAAWFILIVLIGFIPDAIAKVHAVQTGQRPPFPLVMHMHAVAMGSFLVLLLAQTVMVATGRGECLSPLGRMGGYALVLVNPCVGLSTREVYERVPVDIARHRQHIGFEIADDPHDDHSVVAGHLTLFHALPQRRMSEITTGAGRRVRRHAPSFG